MRRERAGLALGSAQLAHERARDAGCSKADKEILAALVYLLAAKQRPKVRDRLSTAQIAFEAGLWDGHGECPETVREGVGRKLGVLAQAQAILYRPARWKGEAGLVALIPADIDHAIGPVELDPHDVHGDLFTDGKVAKNTRPSRAQGREETATMPQSKVAKNTPFRSRKNTPKAPQGIATSRGDNRGRRTERARTSAGAPVATSAAPTEDVTLAVKHLRRLKVAPPTTQQLTALGPKTLSALVVALEELTTTNGARQLLRDHHLLTTESDQA